MNNDNFLIEENILEVAKNICNDIQDSEMRTRSVANAFAATVVSKYFTEVEVDTQSGLHTIAQVLNKIDISDVYIKNNYIDVRVYFNDEELCVPKSHFDDNLLPVAYMFVKLSEDLSAGLVTGFIAPESINTDNLVGSFYKIREDDLVSYYDIEPLLITIPTGDYPDNAESLIFDYLDGKLTKEDENTLYSLLLVNPELRLKLRDAAKVRSIFNFVSEVPVKESEEKEELLVEENDELVSMELPNEDFLLEETEVAESFFEEDVVLEDENTVQLDETVDIEEFSIEPLEEEAINLSEYSEELEESFEEDVTVNADTFVEFDSVSNDISESVEVEEFLPEEEPILGEYQEQEEVIDSEDFATVITPSLEAIETGEAASEEVSLDELENLLDDEPSNTGEVEQSEMLDLVEDELEEKNLEDALEDASKQEEDVQDVSQIENLFGEEGQSQDGFEEDFVVPVQKKSSKLMPVLGLLAIIAGAGYFGYNKYLAQQEMNMNYSESISTAVSTEAKAVSAVKEAMPVETIENIELPKATNEGNAISIPAIEQNLDASILVSNLAVNWEVPVGYTSNPTAERYFKRIGKVIQLNLKTELLLLSKPPITNKIVLELEFNKNSNKFDIKGFTASSGEKLVDDLVKQTVRNALDMNLKTNMNVFGTISGNPMLIIRL